MAGELRIVEVEDGEFWLSIGTSAGEAEFYELEDNILVGAPCCCFEADHHGHDFCEQPSAALLRAERDWFIHRWYSGTWKWIVRA